MVVVVERSRSAPPTTAAVKLHLRGVLRENGVAPGPGWGGYVASLRWKDFEAVEGRFTLPATTQRVIDAARSAGLGVKVRFVAGVAAPRWLVDRVGTFQYTEGQSGKAYTMLRFWDSRVSAAYAAAQAGEAALLDDSPTVREVTMSAAMTVYAEPLQSVGRAAYGEDVAAGMTDASFLAAIRAGIDAHRVWKHTWTDLAVNPQRGEEGDIMDYFRRTLGPGAVLENNSIRATSQPNAPLYLEMLRRGPPISFQTASLSRVGSIVATLDFAVREKAMSVETASDLTAAELTKYNALLAANAGPRADGPQPARTVPVPVAPEMVMPADAPLMVTMNVLLLLGGLLGSRSTRITALV